jgi:hypothetical protein
MSFILAAQRDRDPVGAFKRYADYVDSNRHRFPPSALALVDSNWYFGVEDHSAPHDSWLQDILISKLTLHSKRVCDLSPHGGRCN